MLSLQADVPAVPVFPTAVSSRELHSLLYDGRPAILPVSIRMPDLVVDNVIASGDLLSVIATPGDTASSSRKVSSGDGVLRASPVSMGNSDLAIMSEFSSDTYPDMEDVLCRFQPLQAALSPLSTTTEMVMLTSSSHYPAPAVTVVLSAVSSARVSPDPIREVYSLGTLDVFPTYEQSPDTSLYVLATSPVTPALSEGPVQLLGTESLSPGGPASMDSLLAGDISLMDRNKDLSLLPVPLLPLPNDFGFFPDTGLGKRSSADGPSQLKPCAPVVSTSRDLSQEGPFNAYGATSDTGDLLLISEGLPGCPYRMASYESAKIAVDPAYGLQLHHPRFLEYIGAPKSARLLTRAPGHWVLTMYREEAVTVALQLQHDAGLITSNLQVLGQFVTLLNRMSSEVMRLAFGKEVFPSDTVEAISPAPRIHHAAHYMAAKGLWRPPGRPGAPRPLPISSCKNFVQCTDYFLGLTK